MHLKARQTKNTKKEQIKMTKANIAKNRAEKATESYTRNMTEALAKLETLKTHLTAIGTDAPENANWGHAGDAHRINEWMDTMLEVAGITA